MSDFTKTAQRDGGMACCDFRYPSTGQLWLWKYLGSDNQPVGFTQPEALWQFDGTASQLLDRTANGHDLTLQAGVTFNKNVDSLMALGFMGTDEYRAANNAGLGFAGAFTIEMVLCPSCVCYVTYRAIVGYLGSTEGSADNAQYLLGCNTYGKVEYFCEYGSGTNVDSVLSAIILTGKIQYLAFTRTAGGVLSVYQNGSLRDASAALTMPSGGGSSIFCLGRNAYNAAQYYVGYMFSLRMTADVMSDAQVSWVYAKLRGL